MNSSTASTSPAGFSLPRNAPAAARTAAASGAAAAFSTTSYHPTASGVACFSSNQSTKIASRPKASIIP